MDEVSHPNFEAAFPGGEGIGLFQKSLISWFEREGKSYPWRETEDPYAILVSELMLQQTRVAAVLGKGYFSRWMKKFPDLASLARAEEDELLKAWEGLGYYNRARNLQKAARKICEEHGGVFPRNLEQILALHGVGRYTAGAVVSFAFGERAPIVDGNVVRVLSRIVGYAEPVDTSVAGKLFWDWADRLTPRQDVRSYNSAIMELGQQCCHRTSPVCGECPVSSSCRGSREGLLDRIPRKKNKKIITEKEEIAGIAVSEKQILLCKEGGGRRKGLWRLPEIHSDVAADLEELFRFTYAITRYRVELKVFRLSMPVAGELVAKGRAEWFGYCDGSDMPPMGSPYQKAIQKFGELERELL